MPSQPPRTRRALVIEDDPRLAARLRSHLEQAGYRVWWAENAGAGVERARELRPELVMLDYKLPDGDGRGVVTRLADLAPWPTFVAMSGAAEPLDAFELARPGIHAYLPKPFTPAALDETLQRAQAQAVNLIPSLRTAVGKMTVHEIEELARETMVREALARADGSRSGAARLLRMSRQLLQHVLRRISGSKDPP